MSSHRSSSCSSSEDSAVPTIVPSRNSAGHMTQAGKTPRRMKKQIKVFKDELASERAEEFERPVRSGVTDFFMGVNPRSDAGLSEGPYNSGLTHVLGDVTLQSNARDYQAEGSSGSSPNLKQEFNAKLQGSNTLKTHGGKRLPTMQTSSTTTVVSGKRLPGTVAHIQALPRPTTSVKNLAGLMVYADSVDPPTNSQESSIAELAAGLVPRPVSRKDGPLIQGTVKEHLIPPMDTHWSVRTMQGKSSRAGVEELLRKFGENPKDLRLKTMKTKELYAHAGEMQQRCKALKDVAKLAVEKALGLSALRPVLVVGEDYVSDEETVTGPSAMDQQINTVVSSTKRAREDVDEDVDEEENDGPVVPRRVKRARLQFSAKARGKQPVKVAPHSEVEGEVQEPTSPVFLMEAKDALEVIKRITLEDLARAVILESSDDEYKVSGFRARKGEQMTIIFDSQDKPQLSLKAQQLVRPIMRRRSEILEVYQRWCELGQADLTEENSPYLVYHFGVFKADMGKLKEEVVKIVGDEGVGNNVVVKNMLNDVFAGDMKHGRI